MNNFKAILKNYFLNHDNYKIISYHLNSDSLYVLVNDGTSDDMFESGLIIKIKDDNLEEKCLLEAVNNWKLNLNEGWSSINNYSDL